MTTHEFVEMLVEELEVEEVEFTEETDLSSLEEYDSLAVMTLIALIDEHFKKTLTNEQFQSITTVKSLLDMIGRENFE
jgi:acyl carrier protein